MMNLTKYLAFIVLSLTLPTIGKAQASATVFPGSAWEYHAQPEQLGWNMKKLQELRQFIIDSSNTTGMMVIDHGKVVFEYGNTRDNSYLASCRKSILAMLYGPFVHSKRIILETTLEDLHIDDIGGLLPTEKKATIRNLLTARSGVYHPASNEGDQSAMAPPRGTIAPGSYFLYNNWDFNAAGAILEQLTGQNIYTLADSILAKPLQMQDWVLNMQQKHGDSTRSRFLAYHFWFSTRDMARIGYLMLREGRWHNQQVLPADWVKLITTPVTPYEETLTNNRDFFKFSYGYLWWIWNKQYRSTPFENGYTASGAFGQFITVLPKADLVIAHKTNYDDYRRNTRTETYLRILDLLVAAKTIR